MAKAKLNAGQQIAVDAIVAGRNVFVTGEGGTGKSFAIKKAVALLRNHGRKVVLCAPTGVAAQQIKGSTIHSAFRFDTAPKVADELEKLSPTKVIHAADTIVIDEIGMVRRDLMDAISHVITLENEKRENEKDPDEKKDPLQLVVVGDFSQLPPVVTDKDKKALEQYYGDADHMYAFESDGWGNLGLETIMLTEVMRQEDDTFIAMLNRARIGDKTCIPYFNQLAERGPAPSEALSIVSTNKKAKSANDLMLDKIESESRVFYGQVEGKFKESDMAALQQLVLKTGARVMCLANEPMSGYSNGSVGVVSGFDISDGEGNSCIKLKLDTGDTVLVKQHEWQNLEYEIEKIDGKDVLKQKLLGSYTQYPIKLAWAITAHKSQGQTLSKILIDPTTFADGQLYVALSRATSASGIWLTRPIKPDDLKTSDSVVKFYEDAGWKAPAPASGIEVADTSDADSIEGRASELRAIESDSNDDNQVQAKPLADLDFEEILDELHRLLTTGSRAWVRIYKLIDRVRREGLYKPTYRSFTAWLKAEAKREGVNESLLWRRKSAGDFYTEWASNNDGAPDLEKAQSLSEENLELVRKISGVDKQRGADLMNKLVKDGLSTKELRAEWKATRPSSGSDNHSTVVECIKIKRKTLVFPSTDEMDRAIALLKENGFKVE